MKKLVLIIVILLVLGVAFIGLRKAQKRAMLGQPGTTEQSTTGSADDMSDFDSSMDQVVADDTSDDSDLSL